MISSRVIKLTLIVILTLLCSRIEAQLRSDPINPIPTVPWTTTAPAQVRTWQMYEAASVRGRMFRPFVYSGGLHAISASLTTNAFATEAFVPERVAQTAAAITYFAASDDICWLVISSSTAGLAGWTRMGSTAYYYQCQGNTIPSQPMTPANSTFLSMAVIASDAIINVIDVSNRGPLASEINGVIVARYATSGNGTEAHPYEGWDTAITWQPFVHYIFPDGFYAYDESPNLGLQGIRLTGIGRVVLQYNGTGNALILNGQSTGLTPNGAQVGMDNFTINGNSNALIGLYMRQISHSNISNIRIMNISTTALKCEWCIANYFSNIVYPAGSEITMTTHATIGVWLDWDAAHNYSSENTFINAIIEGVRGNGWYLDHAQNTRIIGGTSESNTKTGATPDGSGHLCVGGDTETGYGVYLTASTLHNEFFGGDYEQNHCDLVNPFFHDIIDFGVTNKFVSVFGGSAFIVGSGAKGTTLIAGKYQDIILNAGALSLTMIGVSMAHTIQDNSGGASLRRYATWNTNTDRFDDLDLNGDIFGRSTFFGNIQASTTDTVPFSNYLFQGPDRPFANAKGTIGIVDLDASNLRSYWAIDKNMGTRGRVYFGAVENTVGPIPIRLNVNGGIAEAPHCVAADLTTTESLPSAFCYCTDCGTGACPGGGTGRFAFKVSTGWTCPAL